jgi:hypothetical protein
MRWAALDSGVSWWLENNEGRTQGYVVKIGGQYLPCLMHNSNTDLLLRMDTLEAAQEHVLVWLAEKKLEGT